MCLEILGDLLCTTWALSLCMATLSSLSLHWWMDGWTVLIFTVNLDHKYRRLALLQDGVAAAQPIQAALQQLLHGPCISAVLRWRLNAARRCCHSPTDGLHHTQVSCRREVAEAEACSSSCCNKDQEDVWWGSWCDTSRPLVSAAASAEIRVSCYSYCFHSVL